MKFKHRLQSILQGNPWLTRLGVNVYRLTQPKFSAGVVGVLMDDQRRVLLVQHVFHLKQAWGLPGGWLGRGEQPHRGIEREFMEETGLAVRATFPLVMQMGGFWHNHLDIAFMLEAHSDLHPVKLCYELTDYGWFALDALPPLRSFHQRVVSLLVDEDRAGWRSAVQIEQEDDL